jgi:hypothetical protein
MSYYNFHKQTNLFEQAPGPGGGGWDFDAKRFMGVIQSSSGEIQIDLPNLVVTNNETGQRKRIIVHHNKDGGIAGPSLTHYYQFDNGTTIQFKPIIVDGVRQGGQIGVDVNNGPSIPVVTGWVATTPPDKFDATWIVDLFGGTFLGSKSGGGAVEDIIIDPGTNPSGGGGGVVPGPLVHGETDPGTGIG